MATTNHYDLIVIGHDLAGLVAATLVAKRGKRVVLIPHGPAEGSYRLGREERPLDTAPLLHLSSPVVRQVYEELGMWTQLRREIRPVDRLVHWVLPGARLDLGPSEAGLRAELMRCWPRQPATLEAWSHRKLLAEAAEEGMAQILDSDRVRHADAMWNRRFLARAGEQLVPDGADPLAPLPEAHPLRGTLGALAPWLQDLSPARLGTAAALRLDALWALGPQDRAGGVAGLRQLLLQRFSLKSGELKPGLRVGEVLVKRGRVTGITLLGKRDRYGCDRMIVASDPRELVDGPLPPELLPRPLALTLAGISAVAYRYVLHLELDERGVPPGLDGMAVCVPAGPDAGPDARPRHGVGLSYLRSGPVDDGLRRISITRIVGHGEALGNLRERILHELDLAGVLPFAARHLRAAHSPHDGRGVTDGAGDPVEGRFEGDSAIRLPMRPLYEARELALGVGLLPHSTGLKNLSFASRLTLPGLGLEGEFAAGLAAANLVCGPTRAGLGRGLFSR